MKRTDEKIKRTEINSLTDRQLGLQRGVPAALKGHTVAMLEKSWLGPCDPERAAAGKETGLERKTEIVYEIDGQEVRDLKPSTIIRALSLPTYTSEEVAEKTGLSLSQIHKTGTRHGKGMKLSGGYAWTEADIEFIEEQKGKRGRPARS